MKRNMKAWLAELISRERKQPLPILSFPSVSLLDVSVRELISDPALQAAGMKAIADRVPSSASVSMMDLSVEAEAFGAQIRFSDNEVPTVTGAVISDAEDAAALPVPAVGAARTGIYVEAIRRASELITDRPVFAGIIGPYSLAGRLLDVNEAMIKCYEEPETVHAVLRKVTDFLIAYARAYRDAGANGIMMAEPLAGLLSPDLTAEFSEPYVKEIFDAVKSDEFSVIYHNCGDCTVRQIDSILRTCADGYHFGNAIRMEEMLPHIPADIPVMGNLDPAGQLRNGTPASVREETLRIMENCCAAGNFVISSGCDIPPQTPWENIDAFFAAAAEYYDTREKRS